MSGSGLLGQNQQNTELFPQTSSSSAYNTGWLFGQQSQISGLYNIQTSNGVQPNAGLFG